EILARQHYQTLAPHAERLGIEVALLVGGLPEAEKEAQRRDLASGRVRVVLGTHALISGAVRFESLGLAVIDEQHRFGVAQRLALRDKADHPDILIMTATPIPRSLAMTVYGDLDLSTIEGLPPGRQPVDTLLFGPEEREGAYGRLAEIIRNGGQAYVVAPRIEASDEEDGEDLAAAETLREYLSREVLPGTPVGLVHGRMKAEEQERVLGDFREGRLRVLTATTVIEVGLDVPAADMILIEGAERFGLAQLHQLRGRVGRGGRPAWCLLVAGGEKASASARLRLMARTGDGFLLAEEDLKLRGPGDATGVKQTGLPPLTWARLPRDLPLLTRARDLAREILEPDPELSDPKFKLVRETMDLLDRRIRTGLADVG
ncbi:MAG: DNA helicase RecG, partial [Proteobacteria bacterium]|nr:DNA helicase RecG [Pseudomonadota bacterium]